MVEPALDLQIEPVDDVSRKTDIDDVDRTSFGSHYALPIYDFMVFVYL